MSYLLEDDYEAALHHFQKAIEEDPDWLEGKFLLGYCQLYVDRYSQASGTLDFPPKEDFRHA
ncbi:tetratricopeptide repeat protein [Acidobacteria bacterium AH-259-O06]|nr:tetratricopeptide repeat protein [Acidobacteria bacterium AH-259-O06]